MTIVTFNLLLAERKRLQDKVMELTAENIRLAKENAELQAYMDDEDTRKGIESQ